MSANQRGALIFIIMIAVAVFFCGIFPTTFLANNGIAFALPVIQVPGEVYKADWPSPDFEFTNTLMGMLVADALVLLLAFWAYQKSSGWRNEVPGRFQGLIESLVGFLSGTVKDMAGTAPQVRGQLYPLVASIFFFLLIANWIELIPGVDSVGLMHCAKPGMSGYGRMGDSLYSTESLFGGYLIESEGQYHACEEVLEGHVSVDTQYDAEVVHEIEAVTEQLADSELSAEARAELVHEYEALTGYEHVAFFPTAEELQKGVQPYGFIVTPFIRAAATDMNLTFGMAFLSVMAMQYFGVSALGLGYFQKFVNIKALGNVGKRPMGLMDFGVGLFEIVSEFSKMISLAFRLFGNIFAGQLLLFILGFLVATLLPVAIYGLEFAVGAIQAYVFAILTLVFSAQAMESHAHDDEEHH